MKFNCFRPQSTLGAAAVPKRPKTIMSAEEGKKQWAEGISQSRSDQGHYYPGKIQTGMCQDRGDAKYSD